MTETDTHEQVAQANRAALRLANVDAARRDAALTAIAEAIRAHSDEILDANAADVEDLVTASSTGGFGGIQTKVRGARDVAEHGIPAVIAGSAEPRVLEKIAEAESVGTIFVPINGGVDD